MIAKKIPWSELFMVEKATHQNLLCHRVMWDRIHSFLKMKLNMVSKWKNAIDSTADDYLLATPKTNELKS